MKPYTWKLIAGLWHVKDSQNSTVAIIPNHWEDRAEGVAEGIARALNGTREILLPSASDVDIDDLFNQAVRNFPDTMAKLVD